jgi:hypothetical protein
LKSREYARFVEIYYKRKRRCSGRNVMSVVAVCIRKRIVRSVGGGGIRIGSGSVKASVCVEPNIVVGILPRKTVRLVISIDSIVFYRTKLKYLYSVYSSQSSNTLHFRLPNTKII